MQTEACEAICGAFRDHFPDRAETFKISGTWPGAKVMIKGTKIGFTAWIEPWIGLDYSDPDDGMDTIEIDIDLRADRRSMMERVNDIMFHREPRPTKKAERPELELNRKAPPARELAPTGRPEKAPAATQAKLGVKPAPERKPRPNQGAKTEPPPEPASTRKGPR